jgi:hypothetical protein
LNQGFTPVVVNTGQQANITISAYEHSGPQSISHVGLYTDFSQLGLNPAYANTAVVYDLSGNQILNNNGNIKTYSITTATEGNKFAVTFNIVFAKPMGTQTIIFRMWNIYGASSDAQVLHALNIVSPAGSSSTQSTIQRSSPVTTTQIDMMTAIKDWGGYSPHGITDAQLLSDMGIKGHVIPSWVMKTTKWVVDDEVSQQEFISVIKYMSEKGIIK